MDADEMDPEQGPKVLSQAEAARQRAMGKAIKGFKQPPVLKLQGQEARMMMIQTALPQFGHSPDNASDRTSTGRLPPQRKAIPIPMSVTQLSVPRLKRVIRRRSHLTMKIKKGCRMTSKGSPD
jgi:hypothetical protein